MLPFFGGSVYDDPAVYKRSSPMEFIKRVKTPVLMLVGDQDGECPLPQSQEFWHALKELGVQTRLVVYPGEGHGIVGKERRRDVLDSTMGWFDQYLVTKK
jgi:dipeptidyl aminopeptidase/acylaminoacyl peptidase